MAKSATKTKGANLPVPQSRDAAASMIYEIGTIERDLQRLDADLKDKLAAVKKAFEEKALPLTERKTELIEGVKIFCEARRDELTGGKTKTIAFTTGTVSWRLRPASVKIRGGEENLVLAIQSIGGPEERKFIRIRHEINREAMLADKEKALTLPGVTISSEGEDFEVKPASAEGLEGAAA